MIAALQACPRDVPLNLALALLKLDRAGQPLFFAAQKSALGVALARSPSILAGVGATAQALHLRRYRSLLRLRLAVDTAFGIATVVNPRINARKFEGPIDMSIPLGSPGLQQGPVIPRAHFSSEALWRDLAGSQKNVRMNVAFIAAAVSGMNSQVGHHTPRNELLANIRTDQCKVLLQREFMRQRQLNLTRDLSVFATFCRFDGIPKTFAIANPGWCFMRYHYAAVEHIVTPIIERLTSPFVMDALASAIGRRRWRAATIRARYHLSRKTIGSHTMILQSATLRSNV
jgi:hypothetical protein